MVRLPSAFTSTLPPGPAPDVKAEMEPESCMMVAGCTLTMPPWPVLYVLYVLLEMAPPLRMVRLPSAFTSTLPPGPAPDVKAEMEPESCMMRDDCSLTMPPWPVLYVLYVLLEMAPPLRMVRLPSAFTSTLPPGPAPDVKAEM